MMALLVGLTSLFGWFGFAQAEMSSTNYLIRWDTVSAGGSDTGSSATYLLRDTVGGTGIGGSSSATYQTSAGYRAGVDDEIVAFEVVSQVTSSEVAATVLLGTNISVASVVGYTTGDFIALVQDKGASQVAAIGKITSVGVNSFIVDAWANNGTMPTIDGTNDYVYRLSGATVSLEELSVSAVTTAIIGFNVTAAVDGGYTVQVKSDGLLRSASNNVNDVADGTVTAGAEEYGARSSDTSVTDSTFDTQDTAFATSFQPLVDVTSTAFEQRTFLTLKAAMAATTVNDTYSQVLSLILSPNF